MLESTTKDSDVVTSSGSQEIWWQSVPLDPNEYPSLGYTSFGEEMTVENWLDSTPFSSPLEKTRIETLINKKFEEFASSEDLADYPTWSVAVTLTPNTRGGYDIYFMTGD